MDYTDLMLCHVVILNSISSNFIFKGALLLKLLGGLEPFRATVDIDFDFTETSISQASLDQIIDLSCRLLREQGYPVYCNCFRPYGDGRSAGYDIFNEQGLKLYHIDISVRVQNSNTTTMIGSIPVKCATIEKIICDKLSAISSKIVNRRVKDVFDLYYLSSICDISYRAVVNTFTLSGRPLGDFSVFLGSYDNLSHAYSLYKGICQKQDFAVVYAQVKYFCLPFYKYGLSGTGEAIWLSKDKQWIC